jgi:SAM-dependent methyltransferase
VARAVGHPGEYDRRTYEDPRIVASYAENPQLQPPERAALELLADDLGRMDMLDLGVGAGRTTWFFAARAKSYLGLDCAPAMVERARAELPAYDFVVGDASRLDFAADGSYDLVLFSFNGIDHLDLAGRVRALDEMVRVLRPGGTLLFSTHNANYLPAIVDRFRPSLRPLKPRTTFTSLKRAALFNLHNPTLRFRMPLSVGFVNDGVPSFDAAEVCFIRPDLQVEALRRLGMRDIVCAPDDGAEFVPGDATEVAGFTCAWVYFLSRKPAPH